MNKNLNIDHQNELLQRSQDYKRNQVKVQNHCAKYGLVLKPVKVEEIANYPNCSLTQRAVRLFVASELKKFKDKGETVTKLDISYQFQSLPIQDQRQYKVAALLHDPQRKSIYSSNAFIVFLAKFVDNEKKKFGVRGRFSTEDATGILKEAKLMWKNLEKNEKLPFHLYAYLCSYVPRRMDAACSEYYN